MQKRQSKPNSTAGPDFSSSPSLEESRSLVDQVAAPGREHGNALGPLLSAGGVRGWEVGGVGERRGTGPGGGPILWAGLRGGPTRPGLSVGETLALQRKMAPRRNRVSTLPRLQLWVLLFLPLLLVPQPIACHGGKYSREKNEPEMVAKREPGEEFRMEKMNQLWQKAQRVSRECTGLGVRSCLCKGERTPGQKAGVGSGPGAAYPLTDSPVRWVSLTSQ